MTCGLYRVPSSIQNDPLPNPVYLSLAHILTHNCAHWPFSSHHSIHKYASCSNECFVFALIYIDRLIQRSNFLLTELNVHRVVITAVLLAAKFYDDAYYNNAYYAKVGGVLVSEMNGLEIDFLFRVNFSLHVAPDIFTRYRSELMVHSSVVVDANNNGTAAMMPPIMEVVYSPQTVPAAADSSARIPQQLQQHHHGQQQHQVTPSPPTPDRFHHLQPPDYGRLHYEFQYDVVAQHQQQQLGFHPIMEQHPQQHAAADALFPVQQQQQQVKVTPPSYYPQHFADNPYYVPPPPHDCTPPGWYGMLGMTGV